MFKFKKTIAVLLLAMLIFTIAGCSSNSDPKKTDVAPAQEQKVKQVTDANGTKVDIPDKIDKIVITCQGGTTHEVLIFGAGDKIVAQPPMNQFPQLLKIYPGFKDVVNPGTFDDVNIEEVIKADPDMVLVGISSKKGNQLIADAGFPTFTMLIGWANIETLKNEFIQMGTLLGNEKKANELVKYWDEKITYVNKMIASVPQEQRKSVLYTSKKFASVSGKNVWGDSLITVAGGINAAAEITDNSKVSVEQIMKWDPDVIIMQKNADAVTEMKNDLRIADLNAVKAGQVYQVPIGGFWWDRPSPESPLGFMWLATKLYPEYTKDIDLKKETKQFFKEFYNYELSDDEYNSFF